MPNGSPEIVFLDACVLYPASLRDFLLRLARQGAFRPRWSEVIVAEFVRNILQNIPDLPRSSLDRTVARMNEAFSESMVIHFKHLIAGLD